jgi:hydrogenase nickel incorporation protein HypA/HybF
VHEWALAQAVVKAVLEHGAKGRIIVNLGELQKIDGETFRFALDEIAKSDGLAPEIAIRVEPAVMKCRSCGHAWRLTDSRSRLTEDQSESIHFVPDVVHVYVRCPSCGSPDFEIISGRGVTFEVEQ